MYFLLYCFFSFEDEVLRTFYLFCLGVTGPPASGIESMNPETPEEFAEFAQKLKEKISMSEVCIAIADHACFGCE